MATKEIDFAIVGAGVSGLIAATTIKKKAPQATFVVLEAGRVRVGGRIHTSTEGGCELGAAFYGPTQNRMLNLLQELKIGTYEIGLSNRPESGASIFMLNGKVRKFDFSDFSVEGNAAAKADIHAALQRLETDIARVNPAHPHHPPKPESVEPLDIAAMDRIPLATYLRGLCATKDAFEFLHQAFQQLMTQDPEVVSALCGLWFARASGSFSALLDGETWRSVEGNSRIPERLAARIGGPAVVKLGCAVRTVDTTHADGRVRISGEGFDDIVARRVIFAIPPHQLSRVRFEPPLPAERTQELQKWAVGHCIKTFTTYPQRFWLEKGYCGRAIAKGRPAECPSTDIYDDSPKGSGPKDPGTLLAFIDASYANHWVKKTEEERKAALAQHFAKLFGDDRLLHPSGYQERLWSTEPWIGGCFFALPMPGVLADFGRGWREPWADNRVFFASTEAANHWFGYMEGGYEAGERAAYGALVSLGLLPKGTLPPPMPAPPKGYHGTPVPCFDPKVAAQAKPPQLVSKL